MRLTLRLLAGLIPAAALANCGTDAIGVDACRQIEAARCSALLSCPAAAGGFTSAAQVDACTLFYRDQCLHGIESTRVPEEAETTACVAAVQATAACAKAGAATMEGCAAAPLVSTADPKTIAPCAAILGQVHLLNACAFVSATPDAGVTPTPTSDAGNDAASADAAAD